MTKEHQKPLVGIIESDVDIAKLLKEVFRENGFLAASELFSKVKQHQECFVVFLKKYNPRVLIIDIPYPYQENWEYIKKLRRLKESERRGFIALTNNRLSLTNISEEILMVKKPFDLDDVINAVKKFA